MLCLLLGEKNAEAFTALCEPLPGATTRSEWGEKWHPVVLNDVAILKTFTQAIGRVVREQQAHALEVQPRLLEQTHVWKTAGSAHGPPLPLFRLAAETGFSLATGAVGNDSDKSAPSTLL